MLTRRAPDFSLCSFSDSETAERSERSCSWSSFSNLNDVLRRGPERGPERGSKVDVPEGETATLRRRLYYCDMTTNLGEANAPQSILFVSCESDKTLIVSASGEQWRCDFSVLLSSYRNPTIPVSCQSCPSIHFNCNTYIHSLFSFLVSAILLSSHLSQSESESTSMFEATRRANALSASNLAAA